MASDLRNELRFVVGEDGVLPAEADASVAIDGRHPTCIVLPHDRGELRRVLAFAQKHKQTVIPFGNTSQLSVGPAPQSYDIALGTTRVARIVAHEAGDMTVTVEAGATLAAVNERLAGAGQHLPLDPPLPSRVTIGGLIAADQWGPSRASHGKVRDLLIGITVALQDGRLVHGGGRVVKNVAGYDLMKLFTGSWGTLGVVLEATFKVRPLPAAASLFMAAVPDLPSAMGLARRVIDARLSPAYVVVLSKGAAQAIVGESRDMVLVSCAGIPAEIDNQRQRLAALLHPVALDEAMADRAAVIQERLRDWPAMTSASWGARISLLPTRLESFLSGIGGAMGANVDVVSHNLSGVAVLRGISPLDSNQLRELRRAVRVLDGYVVFDRLPADLKRSVDVWGEDVPGLDLMRGIKQALDPQRRLSPGRFVGGI